MKTKILILFLQNSYRLGLKRVEGIIALFVYILPEFLILICVMTQQFYEFLLGVHDKREIYIENISEARERFLGQFNEQAQRIKGTLKSLKRTLPTPNSRIVNPLILEEEEKTNTPVRRQGGEGYFGNIREY